MKLLLSTLLLCLVIVSTTFAQNSEQAKADSIAKVRENYNPYKNTISWDFSSLIHGQNYYYYGYYNPLDGYYYGPSAFTNESSIPAGIFFRHRVESKKFLRLDQATYWRASLFFNFTHFNSSDSASYILNNSNGYITARNPQSFNDIYTFFASLGIERDYNLNKFQLFYALDFLAAYSNAAGIYFGASITDTVNKYYSSGPTNVKDLSFGVSPGIGVNYYFNHRFSVGIESAFILNYVIQSSEIVEQPASNNKSIIYKLPSYHFIQGNYIPLRAIKASFSF